MAASEVNALDAVRVQFPTKSKCPCSTKQLVMIIIPIASVILYLAIFLPIYYRNKGDKFKVVIVTDDNSTNSKLSFIEKYDQFKENIFNNSYSTLTPENGYDKIYIHLGDINETSNKYFDFFRSKRTFIPPKTKIIFLSAESSLSWFNINVNENYNLFDEIKNSTNQVLTKIDKISNEEKINYDNIFIGGYGQGGVMINSIILNSNNEFGGFISLSGFILDNGFLYNNISTNLTKEQKEILEHKKNYKIFATYSLNNQDINKTRIIQNYLTYYGEFTNFNLYIYRSLKNEFLEQPIFPIINQWLKEIMYI
jgi:hypothetical protein